MATIEKNTAADGATTWAVRYRKPDGRTTRRRGFKTQRDAKAFAATVETSKLKGEYRLSVCRPHHDRRVGPGVVRAAARVSEAIKPSISLERTWRVLVAPRWAHVRIADDPSH